MYPKWDDKWGTFCWTAPPFTVILPYSIRRGAIRNGRARERKRGTQRQLSAPSLVETTGLEPAGWRWKAPFRQTCGPRRYSRAPPQNGGAYRVLVPPKCDSVWNPVNLPNFAFR